MANRQTTVSSPLGEQLLFHRMRGREELGRLFCYEVELLSEKDDVSPGALLGQPMTVNVALPSGDVRHFHGHVSRFARVGWSRRHVVHQATLRPWLWLLTRKVDCGIFQNMSIPDVLRKVFREFRFAQFEEHLTGSYPVREYIVQYRESDFDFLSRLMEEVGLYYFFKHTAEGHTLVLVDDQVGHDAMPGYAEVPYYPPNTRVDEHFDHWSSVAEVQSGSFALDDYRRRRRPFSSSETIRRATSTPASLASSTPAATRWRATAPTSSACGWKSSRPSMSDTRGTRSAAASPRATPSS